MNADNPLANLRDIHLPEQISWWPLAPGWWLLILLVCLTLVWLGYKLRQRHLFRQTYRYCQSQLTEIDQTYQASKDSRQLVSDYSQLLRRLLMLRLGRQHVASLTGEQLLAILDEHNLCSHFDEETKTILVDGPYQKQLSLKDYASLSQVRSL